MNGIVNVLWKYCCGVAAGVFVQYSLTIIGPGIPFMS